MDGKDSIKNTTPEVGSFNRVCVNDFKTLVPLSARNIQRNIICEVHGHFKNVDVRLKMINHSEKKIFTNTL